jgi:hypothetical protein
MAWSKAEYFERGLHRERAGPPEAGADYSE